MVTLAGWLYVPKWTQFPFWVVHPAPNLDDTSPRLKPEFAGESAS